LSCRISGSVFTAAVTKFDPGAALKYYDRIAQLQSESGQGIAEYSMILSIFFLGLIGVIQLFGLDVIRYLHALINNVY